MNLIARNKNKLTIPITDRYETIYTFKSLQPCFVRSTIENDNGIYNPRIFEQDKSGNMSHSIRKRLAAKMLINCRSESEMLKQLQLYGKKQRKSFSKLNTERHSKSKIIKSSYSRSSIRPKVPSASSKGSRPYTSNNTRNVTISGSQFRSPTASYSCLYKNQPKFLSKANHLTVNKYKENEKEEFATVSKGRRRLILGI